MNTCGDQHVLIKKHEVWIFERFHAVFYRDSEKMFLIILISDCDGNFFGQTLSDNSRQRNETVITLLFRPSARFIKLPFHPHGFIIFEIIKLGGKPQRFFPFVSKCSPLGGSSYKPGKHKGKALSITS